jgi:hypothetical protein
VDVLTWKAWYRGGQAYCATGHEWADLPDDGVLGVVVVFDEKSPGTEVQLRRFVSGSDLYWACEIDGHFTICQGAWEDKPHKRYPGAEIKKGVWTSDEEMQRVNDEMKDWRG